LPRSSNTTRATPYRIDVEYDGTRYHGWQEQTNARTVAGELRAAAERAVGPVTDLQGAGRTDAGVHALRQVAHLAVATTVEPDVLRLKLNDALPPDLNVLGVRRAPPGFHARHSAVARSYVYQIARRRTAFAKRFVWWVKRPLDPQVLAGAAALVRGRHDFVRFTERPTEQPSTLVVVEAVEVREHGALVLVRIVASHFLWRMVRRIVGTLVEIGAGGATRDDLATLLTGERLRDAAEAPAKWTAPPSGLFLERVVYPGEPELEPLGPAFGVGLGREARVRA
jgi:tRNA pseudouridine38-40 synthase